MGVLVTCFFRYTTVEDPQQDLTYYRSFILHWPPATWWLLQSCRTANLFKCRLHIFKYFIYPVHLTLHFILFFPPKRVIFYQQSMTLLLYISVLIAVYTEVQNSQSALFVLLTNSKINCKNNCSISVNCLLLPFWSCCQVSGKIFSKSPNQLFCVL